MAFATTSRFTAANDQRGIALAASFCDRDTRIVAKYEEDHRGSMEFDQDSREFNTYRRMMLHNSGIQQS
jgi:hypothetical protein